MLAIIYFKPGAQHENTGDALINKCAVKLYSKFGKVRLLKGKLPDSYVNSISNGQAEIIHAGDLSFLALTIVDSIKQIKKNKHKREDLFYVLPPGHTQRDGIKPFLFTVKVIFLTVLLNLFRVKVVRLGVSVAGGGKINRTIESLLSKIMHCYGVRDEESLSYCKDNGFSNVIWFPDLAWLHEPSSGPKAQRGNKYDIVLSFRSNSTGRHHNESYLDNHLELLDFLINSYPGNIKKRLLVSYQVDFDRNSALKIINYLSNTTEAEYKDCRLGMEDAENLYRNSGLVISNRLHVLLLAGISGSVPIGVVRKEDNKKIISLFDGLGMSDILLIIDGGESKEELIRKFHSISKRAVRKKFKEVSEKMKSEAIKKARSIF